MRATALLLSASTLFGCAEHIGRAELAAQVESGEPPVIVDVRSRAEFEQGHVPGALHVPFYSLLSRADELPPPRNPEEPVVVYCEHGPRAGLARAQLWLAGDRPVRFLEGHMSAWRRDGRPVERVEETP
jgi:rhodanese-related sulfurtransferase